MHTLEQLETFLEDMESQLHNKSLPTALKADELIQAIAWPSDQNGYVSEESYVSYIEDIIKAVKTNDIQWLGTLMYVAIVQTALYNYKPKEDDES